jgi:hypothetical protein
MLPANDVQERLVRIHAGMVRAALLVGSRRTWRDHLHLLQ